MVEASDVGERDREELWDVVVQWVSEDVHVEQEELTPVFARLVAARALPLGEGFGTAAEFKIMLCSSGGVQPVEECVEGIWVDVREIEGFARRITALLELVAVKEERGLLDE